MSLGVCVSAPLFIFWSIREYQLPPANLPSLYLAFCANLHLSLVYPHEHRLNVGCSAFFAGDTVGSTNSTGTIGRNNDCD